MWERAMRSTPWSGRTMFLLALAFAVFSFLDCATTTYAVSHGAAEQNPVQAAVLGHGVTAFYTIRLAVVAVVLAALQLVPRRAAPWVGLIATSLTGLVVAANLHTISG